MHKLLEIKYKVNDEHQLVPVNFDPAVLFDGSNWIVDNLRRAQIYIFDYLLRNGYHQQAVLTSQSTRAFSSSGSDASITNIRVCDGSRTLTTFCDFERKFGREFEDLTSEERQQLVDYAIERNRYSNTAAQDSYDEWLSTIYNHKGGRTRDVNRRLVKSSKHQTHVRLSDDVNAFLEEIKPTTSGFQFCKPGKYQLLYDYDRKSAYPSELLAAVPVGDARLFGCLEEIPAAYWYCIEFIATNVRLKADCRYDWANSLENECGIYVMTKELHELFVDHYDFDEFKSERLVGFKTKKGLFDKFVLQNCIEGRAEELPECIRKYNNFIAKCLTGYCGKRAQYQRAIMAYYADIGEIGVEKVTSPSSYVYLPLYLFVVGRSKAKFINAISNSSGEIYGNTDGFLTTKELDLDELNFDQNNRLGSFVLKGIYTDATIKGVNNYIMTNTKTGELESIFPGIASDEQMSLVERIDYKKGKIELYAAKTLQGVV